MSFSHLFYPIIIYYLFFYFSFLNIDAYLKNFLKIKKQVFMRIFFFFYTSYLLTLSFHISHFFSHSSFSFPPPFFFKKKFLFSCSGLHCHSYLFEIFLIFLPLPATRLPRPFSNCCGGLNYINSSF